MQFITENMDAGFIPPEEAEIVRQFARVRESDNVVVNIEMATSEWVKANEGEQGYYFVEHDEFVMPNGPYIGYPYDPQSGLFLPPSE